MHIPNSSDSTPQRARSILSIAPPTPPSPRAERFRNTISTRAHGTGSPVHAKGGQGHVCGVSVVVGMCAKTGVHLDRLVFIRVLTMGVSFHIYKACTVTHRENTRMYEESCTYTCLQTHTH